MSRYSASLRAAETYLNHFHGHEANDAGSRRTSVRSSLFAKAWLGPNSPLQVSPSTRPSVMMLDGHLHGGGDGTAHGGEDLISPTRLGSISIASANSTGPLSLPKINKVGSISVDHSLNSSLNSRHADDLQSPSSVAASLASSLFPTSHSNNNSNNSTAVNSTASFLPRLVDPSPHGDGSGGHLHHHAAHLHDRERRDSFAKDGAAAGEKHIYDFLMSNESRCDSARLQVDGADPQQQPPSSSSAAAHHVTMLPPLDDGGHYTGSPLVASSAQNSARKNHFHHTGHANGNGGAAATGSGTSSNNNNNGGGGIGGTGASSKGNRDRLQRRSLGNANFAPPSSAKHGKGNGTGGGGGPEDSPALSVGSVKSVTGSPSRLLRRSFGMDPIQARSLESEKFGATLPKLTPIAGNGTAAVAAPAAATPSL